MVDILRRHNGATTDEFISYLSDETEQAIPLRSIGTQINILRNVFRMHITHDFEHGYRIQDWGMFDKDRFAGLMKELRKDELEAKPKKSHGGASLH